MNIKDRLSYCIHYKKLKNIKLLISDVDGVMTDGTLVFNDDGIESKIFNAQDGMAVYYALNVGLKIAIVTGSTASCVMQRFKKLKKLEDIIMGEDDKLKGLLTLAEKYGFSKEEIAYIGDDFIDYKAMKYAGISFCPIDAIDEIRCVANIVLSKCGGRGAVKTAVDMILKSKGLYKDVLEKYID